MNRRQLAAVPVLAFTILVIAILAGCPNPTVSDDEGDLVQGDREYSNSGVTGSDGSVLIDTESFEFDLVIKMEDGTGAAAEGIDVSYYQEGGVIAYEASDESGLYADSYHYVDLRQLDIETLPASSFTMSNGSESRGIFFIGGAMTLAALKASGAAISVKAGIGIITKAVVEEFGTFVIDRALNGEFTVGADTTVTSLGTAASWLAQNVTTDTAILQSQPQIMQKVSGEIVEIGPTPGGPQGMQFDPDEPESAIQSKLAAYLMYAEELPPSASHRVRLTLHEHRPTFRFNVGPFQSNSQTWIEIEVVEEVYDYLGDPAVVVVDVEMLGTSAIATVQVVPALAGLSISWELVGTDGYTNSGLIQTDASGQASFSVPAGIGGVRDVATITLTSTDQVITESWIY